MKHKISIPVLVLIVVCALAAIALIQRALSHRNASVRTETAGLLPKFQADDVARFRLSWRDMAVTLVKNKNGVWTVEERALPADPKKVLEFLEAAASIRPLKLIAPADEKTLLRLRTFVQGFNGAIPGARLEMQDKNGKELLNLAMGRGHFLPDDTTPPDQRVPSGRYFALLDSKLNPGSVFLAPTIFEDAPPVPGAWLRQPVFENLNAALGILFRDLPKGRIQWTVSRPDPSRAFEDASGGDIPVQPPERGVFMLNPRPDIGHPAAELDLVWAGDKWRRHDLGRGWRMMVMPSGGVISACLAVASTRIGPHGVGSSPQANSSPAKLGSKWK